MEIASADYDRIMGMSYFPGCVVTSHQNVVSHVTCKPAKSSIHILAMFFFLYADKPHKSKDEITNPVEDAVDSTVSRVGESTINTTTTSSSLTTSNTTKSSSELII